MKNYWITLALFIVVVQGYAQKHIEKNIEYNNQYIELNVKFASEIEIKTWDEQVVYFQADIVTKEGKYLDFYTLDIQEQNSKILITSQPEKVLKEFQKTWNRERKNQRRSYYNTSDWYTFNYVLYVPKNATFKVKSINGDLKSENIAGNFTAELINGDIDIKSYSGDIDLQTINGEVDITMKNTMLVAETVNGDIYADEKLDITVNENRHVGQKISGSFDDATNKLRLNTVNGNLYLRR